MTCRPSRRESALAARGPARHFPAPAADRLQLLHSCRLPVSVSPYPEGLALTTRRYAGIEPRRAPVVRMRSAQAARLGVRFVTWAGRWRVTRGVPGYPKCMKACCPPGQGCNAPPGREEPCLLWRVERADSPDANRALALWDRFRSPQRSHRPSRERRFLRRAYARARDDAVPWRPHLP